MLAIITVTYNPDPLLLRRQLIRLPKDSFRVLVDNASSPEVLVSIRILAAEFGAVLVQNDHNAGLAAALNRGLHLAQERGCDSFLLLDQDTEPAEGAVALLQQAYLDILEQGGAKGCCGPRLIDAQAGLEHGFHVVQGWAWGRRFSETNQGVPIECANLNGSGMLIPAEVLNCVGGMDEELFIDHVDTEWSFRVVDAGYRLYGIPGVQFAHSMGESSIQFWWLRWRVWPSRSPGRHYFLFRNAVLLLARPYVPAVWKSCAILKLLATAVLHALLDPKRAPQIASMFRGVREALASLRKDRA